MFPALQCKCNNCFVGKNIFELWTGPLKVGNKLGNKKAAQLTFVFRYLNQDKQGEITPTDLSEEIEGQTEEVEEPK